MASSLREVFQRIEHRTGFGIKVVERAGASIRSLLPTDMGESTPCGRTECITCNQGSEHIPACTRTSVLYENICRVCNPKAGSKKDLQTINTEVPSVYVGESSRSIQERLLEHWRDWRQESKESHILKHQMLHHLGEKSPDFVARAVGYYRSALERQVAEAVKIRRRGGDTTILNSKAEFNRCKIPRLVVELVDEEQIQRENEGEDQRIKDALANQQQAWEDDKTTLRMKEFKTVLRTKERKKAAKVERKPAKRRTYSLVGENWGVGEDLDWNINKKIRIEDEEDMTNAMIPTGGVEDNTSSTTQQKKSSTEVPRKCSTKVPTEGLEDTMLSTNSSIKTSAYGPITRESNSTEKKTRNSTKTPGRKR